MILSENGYCYRYRDHAILMERAGDGIQLTVWLAGSESDQFVSGPDIVKMTMKDAMNYIEDKIDQDIKNNA